MNDNIKDGQLRSLFIFSLISLAINIGMISLIVIYLYYFYPPTDFKILDAQNTIEIERIDSSLLKKIRTVGVKDGSKDFSMASKAKKRKRKIYRKNNAQKIRKVLSLAALSVAPLQGRLIDRYRRKEEQIYHEKFMQEKISIEKREVFKEATRTLQVSPSDRQRLKDTGFGIGIEPPEGISEDELNSFEKKHYAFQKRIYRLYVRSFLSSYHNLMVERPYLKTGFNIKKTETISGRVRFSYSGDSLKTKVIKGSKNPDVHMLFLKTLESMIVLKNPPTELTRGKKSFNIYYKLKIKD